MAISPDRPCSWLHVIRVHRSPSPWPFILLVITAIHLGTESRLYSKSDCTRQGPSGAKGRTSPSGRLTTSNPFQKSKMTPLTFSPIYKHIP
ncbi:hypothetical protein LX36DRAFT_178740 [Colletotrichum falcatum]|nr:hypothetical protein LX36DRAFT_178740 [Colletotrichum falcatum]